MPVIVRTTSNKRAEFPIKDAKIKLIISKELQSQIMYMHSNIHSKEWSGPVFYTVEGDITDPNNMTITAKRFLLMDVGTAAYTEYEFGPEIMEFYDKYPDAETMKMGHLHTHHTMKTFFSGTDMQELHDNAGSHNYYLSLIVNHESNFSAKVAFIAKRKVKADTDLSYKRGNGEIYTTSLQNVNNEEEVLCTIDCDIIFEQDDFHVKKYEELSVAKNSTYSHAVQSPRVSKIPFTNSFQTELFSNREEKYPHVKIIQYILMLMQECVFNCDVNHVVDGLREMDALSPSAYNEAINRIDNDMFSVAHRCFEYPYSSFTSQDELCTRVIEVLKGLGATKFKSGKELISLLDLYILDEEDEETEHFSEVPDNKAIIGERHFLDDDLDNTHIRTSNLLKTHEDWNRLPKKKK